MRILVIEDDEALARAMRKVLLLAKHQVCIIDSISEYLKTFSEFQPELMIVDMNLRDSRGLETMKCIKDMSKEVPVIVYSASEVWAKEAMRLGAKEYLIKGNFTPMGLVEAINMTESRHKLEMALDRSERARRGDFSWPGRKLANISKAADNMLSLAADLKAVAEG
jgi:DNA-binding NtrC family response regulator